MIEVKIKNKEGVVVIARKVRVRHNSNNTYHRQQHKYIHVDKEASFPYQELLSQAKRGIFCEESFLSSVVMTKNLRSNIN